MRNLSPTQQTKAHELAKHYYTVLRIVNFIVALAVRLGAVGVIVLRYLKPDVLSLEWMYVAVGGLVVLNGVHHFFEAILAKPAYKEGQQDAALQTLQRQLRQHHHHAWRTTSRGETDIELGLQEEEQQTLGGAVLRRMTPRNNQDDAENKQQQQTEWICEPPAWCIRKACITT